MATFPFTKLPVEAFDDATLNFDQLAEYLGRERTVLPFATGNTSIDTANVLRAIAAARATGNTIQAPPAPWPGYVVSAIAQVPSGVTIEGAGEGVTWFSPAAGFAGPVFELSEFSGPISALWEFSGQGWYPGLRRLSVAPSVAMPTPAAINAGCPDTRQVADGIWVHDTDWFVLEDVTVYMLAGYHLKLGPVVRETGIRGFHSWRGGYQPTDKAAVIWEDSTGDQDNLIDLFGVHVGYPAYKGVEFNLTGPVGAQGARMIQWFGGQIEGGGYGGSPATALMTSSTMPPYDLITMKRGRDITFHGTEIGGGTAAGAALVKLLGDATDYLGAVEFRGCPINNVGAGISFDLDRIGVMRLHGGTLFANTAAGANHLQTSANTVRVEWDPTVQVSSTGEDDFGMGLADLSKVKRDRLNWQLVAPLNGWSNRAVYQEFRAAVDRHGHVWVEGDLTGGTSATTPPPFTSVGVLPVGCRPPFAVAFIAENNGVAASLQVQPDGNILILTAPLPNNMGLSVACDFWVA